MFQLLGFYFQIEGACKQFSKAVVSIGLSATTTALSRAMATWLQDESSSGSVQKTTGFQV